MDYEKIIRHAEKEADIVIWDGGNNDFPYYETNLWITVADPLRAGHEIAYYAGEVNAIGADIVVINKEGQATKQNIKKVKDNIKQINPKAKIVDAISEVRVPNPKRIKGKKVLVIEDGPTLTHGGMKYGAGTIAALDNNAERLFQP